MFFKEITRGFGVTAQYIVQDPIKLTILWMSSCWIDLIALPHTLAALFPSPCINLTRLLNAESDEQRVDAEVQCCRNPFPRAPYRESSHWPPPSWRWLKGRITRSDHCAMWSSGCFICQTSCSTDARYIDVPVKTRYLREWGHKKACWPHPAGAENTEIVTVKPSRSIPVRIVLDGWFHASNLIGQRRSPAVWIIPIKLSALGCCYCFAGRFPVTMGRPCW